MNGRIVATPVQEFESHGNHIVTLDFTGLPAGVYTYRLICGEHTASRMMQLLK
jgi:hypothetical protein